MKDGEQKTWASSGSRDLSEVKEMFFEIAGTLDELAAARPGGAVGMAYVDVQVDNYRLAQAAGPIGLAARAIVEALAYIESRAPLQSDSYVRIELRSLGWLP